jgi:dynein heavy chain
LQFNALYALAKDLLSKQLHYDWGLRAVKSVLCVAGLQRRESMALSEHAVLVRALRDFNVPKLVGEDAAVFVALLADLFPDVHVPAREHAEVSARFAC